MSKSWRADNLPTRGAALDEAVRLLRRREQLRQDIEAGIDQLDAGQFVEFDEDGYQRFLEVIKTRFAARSQDG